MIDFDHLERLNAARTRTEHGWWAGEPYCGSFGPVDAPDERQVIRVDDADLNTSADVWAGDPANDEDNTPLIGEFGDVTNARFIAAMANNADELLRLARIGLQHLSADAVKDGSS